MAADAGGADPWTLDGLSDDAAAAFKAVDWSRAACSASWLPSNAWHPDGWGTAPRVKLKASATPVEIRRFADGADVDPDPDWLIVAARAHWAELGYDSLRIGRRSPLVKLAVRICVDECPIREACYEYAVAVPSERGVWGGSFDRGRRDERFLRRRQRHQRS